MKLFLIPFLMLSYNVNSVDLPDPRIQNYNSQTGSSNIEYLLIADDPKKYELPEEIFMPTDLDDDYKSKLKNNAPEVSRKLRYISKRV